MEASRDGKLVRKYHPGKPFRISRAEGTKYHVQRLGKVDDHRVIRCNSKYVSRRHCMIFRKDKAYWIQDLGSSNGTYLNGVRLKPEHDRELRFGDIIGMGISHQPTDESIEVSDMECFVFTFEKGKDDSEMEVVDLEDEDDPVPPPVISKLNANATNANLVSIKDHTDDSDEDIQILAETPSQSSASGSNKSPSPKKPMPPPPPPPVISKSFAAQTAQQITVPQRPAASDKGDSGSSGESTTSTYKGDKRFKPVQKPVKTTNEVYSSSSKSTDVTNKRPLSSDVREPPVKRSKQDKRSNSSSSDDSSDGLGDIDVVNVKKRSKSQSQSNAYSGVSTDDNSSDEEKSDKMIVEDPPSTWTSISAGKQDKSKQKSSSSPVVPVKSCKLIRSIPLRDESDGQSEDEDVGRRKYDGIKSDDAIRDAKERILEVKLQKIILCTNGQYTLTKSIFNALNPSSRRRMQAQFRDSLLRNNHDPVQQVNTTSVVGNSNGDMRTNQQPSVNSSSSSSDEDTDNEDVAAPGSEYKNGFRHNSVPTDIQSSLGNNNEDDFNKFRKKVNSGTVSVKTPETPPPPKNKMPSRGIQLLADAPLPRFAAKAQSKHAAFKAPMPQSASKYQKLQNHNSVSPGTSPPDAFQFMSREDQKQMRILKLKEMELKKQLDREETTPDTPKRTPQPAKIKVTTRNRNQGLMDSIIDSKNKSPNENEQMTDAVAESNNEPLDKPETHPLMYNPMDPRLTSKSRVIPHDPRLKNSVAENSSSTIMPAIPSTSNNQGSSAMTSLKVSAPSNLKPGAEVIKSPTPSIGAVAYREKTKSAYDNTKQRMYPPAVSEDDIYKRILTWRPAWLEEQKNMKDDPPILKENETLTTTLSRYDSYEAYFKIYYPLLLSEIWACISNDAANKSKANEASNNKKNEYQIKVEDVKRTPQCPLVKQSKPNGSPTPSEADNWVIIKYHAWVKRRGEIDYRKDLVILTLTGIDKKTGAKCVKNIFGFPLPNSEIYESINKTQDCDGRLRGKDCEGYRFTEKITCKFGGNFEVDKEDLGVVTRVCNITPKLREFKALNTLGTSRLFRRIISPLEDPKKSWQSWVNQNPTAINHEMISYCQQLNLEQKAIVRCVTSRVSSDEPELMLMHGPPGTGKTTTIIGVVLQLLVTYQKKAPSRNHRILICTPSNAAIDEIMRRLSEAIDKLPTTPNNGKKITMVRVGDGYAPELKKFALDSKVEEIEEEKSTAKSIKAEIEDLDNEMRELDHQIEDMKKQPKTNTIALESKLSKRKEKEKHRNVLKKDYHTVVNKGKSTKDETNIRRSRVISDAQIICSTLSASSTSIMKAFVNRIPSSEKPFHCCIVDEASQTTEPETLLPLTLRIDKLLLVGDPHQLGATVLSTSADEKKYGQSLFSRHYQFYSRNKSSSPVMPLIRQYRMHQDIVKFPNIYFYDSQLQTTYNHSKKNYPLRPYYFLNLSSSRESSKEGQIENVDEVVMVKALVETIDEMLVQTNAKWAIGIITPYAAQKHGIRNEFRNKMFKSFSSLDIDTVDGFQGQERDIIIFSCVRTDATGFLKSRNRLNVALTRAKHSLYIIGDSRCLSSEDMWRCLVKDAAQHNNKFDVNPDFKRDLKLLKIQLSHNLKKNRTI